MNVNNKAKCLQKHISMEIKHFHISFKTHVGLYMSLDSMHTRIVDVATCIYILYLLFRYDSLLYSSQTLYEFHIK